MIPDKIRALFDFIDYLDENKSEYVSKYLPICEELTALGDVRSALRPGENYLQKQKYDVIQQEISEKFQPLHDLLYLPFIQKLSSLNIWSGDQGFISIYNNNVSAIAQFKANFEDQDIPIVIHYKEKYISFRKETNSNFLTIEMVWSELDEIFKQLFDFFKDTTENEFEAFETKVVALDSIQSLVERLSKTSIGKVEFHLPVDRLIDHQNVRKYYPELYQNAPPTYNKIIMGNNIEFRDITGDGNVINAGDRSSLKGNISIKKGDLEGLRKLLSALGIEQTDIEEISEIVRTEQVDSSSNTLGQKSESWIQRIGNKAQSGAGKIATGISSNILAAIIRQHFGI